MHGGPASGSSACAQEERTGRRVCQAATAAAALTKAARVSLPPKPPPVEGGQSRRVVSGATRRGMKADKLVLALSGCHSGKAPQHPSSAAAGRRCGSTAAAGLTQPLGAHHHLMLRQAQDVCYVPLVFVRALGGRKGGARAQAGRRVRHLGAGCWRCCCRWPQVQACPAVAACSSTPHSCMRAVRPIPCSRTGDPS